MLDPKYEISLISLKNNLFNKLFSFQAIIGLMSIIRFLPLVEGYSDIIITVNDIILFILVYTCLIVMLLGAIAVEQPWANKIVEDKKRGRDITK